MDSFLLGRCDTFLSHFDSGKGGGGERAAFPVNVFSGVLFLLMLREGE